MNSRYPQDLTLSKEDFDKEECEKILAGDVNFDRYFSMCQVFSSYFTQAQNANEEKRSKIYFLLSRACSLRFSDNTSEPFEPRRALDDFSDDDIVFFSQILNEIENVWLKARLADIVWVRKRGQDSALIAIDAYRQLPITPDFFNKDTRDCWRRSILLTILLKQAAGNRIEEIENAMIEAFNLAGESDDKFSLMLANLMSKFSLCKDHAELIAEKQELLAKKLDSKRKLYEAADLCNSAISWYKLSNNEEKYIGLLLFSAENSIKKAEYMEKCEHPSHSAARSFYEEAIHTLRRIPRSKRSEFHVDEKIKSLRSRLSEAGERSIEEMGTFTTDPMDVTDVVEGAIKSVSNKALIEALKGFIYGFGSIDIEHMKEFCLDLMDKNPLSSMFSAIHIAPDDGRVIAKTEGSHEINMGSPSFGSQLMQHYRCHVELVAQASIIPALEVMNIEHRITELDFLSISVNAQIIPRGHEGLFAKGFFAGYNRDFVTAVHILSLQVESLVRFHLRNANVSTTRINDAGIEHENSLKTLLEMPEAENVIGGNNLFEMKALFCDPLGADLRNEVAHGLMSYDKCYSLHSVYAWWFLLRLVCNNYFTRLERFENANSDKTT